MDKEIGKQIEVLAMEVGVLRERYIAKEERCRELERENHRLEAQLESLMGELNLDKLNKKAPQKLDLGRYTYDPKEHVRADVARLFRLHKMAKDGMPATYPREPGMPKWARWIAWDYDGACWLYYEEPEAEGQPDDDIVWELSERDSGAKTPGLKEWEPLNGVNCNLKLELV